MTPLEALVPAPIDEVFALFADPHQQPKLHPLIERVTVLSQTPQRVEFELFVRVPFGPFRVANTYWGAFDFEVTTGPERVVRATAKSKPSVVVSGEYRFFERGPQTLVRDAVQFTAPFGLQGFVQRTGTAAHRRMLDALVRHFTR